MMLKGGLLLTIISWTAFVLVFTNLVLKFPRMGLGFVSVFILLTMVIINFFGVDNKKKD